MAVELATGYISLVPSARGFARNLAREIDGPLTAAGADAGDRASRNFGRTFAAGVGAAASRGGLLLAGGLGVAGAFGIKVAADFEQTQIAFEGILGSADKANQVLADLRDFAAKTPFEFPQLSKASQQLLGVGFSAEDLIPTMGTLGDVAAGLGQGPAAIESTVRALGQMKGRGKVASQELIQISEALPGFSAIGAIAEEMGVSTEEAFKLVESGAVSADEGIAAILGGMENFPGAAGAMERQSKTLNGVISTFKDTLATTAIDFITPYLPAISAGVAAFGGFIQNTAVPALDSLFDAVGEIVDIFQTEGLGGVFDRIGQEIAENAPIVGAKLQELGGKLVDWISQAAPPAIEALAGWVGDIAAWLLDPGLGLLGDGVAVLVPALVDWVTDEVIPKLFGTGKGEGAFYDMLAAFAEWVATDAVPAFIQGGKDLGAGLIEGIIAGLGDAFDIKTSKIKIGPIEIDAPLGIKGLAAGGRAYAGEPVVVGERRPELFVPDVNGTVFPEVPSGFGGGQPITLNVIERPGENSGETAMRELRRHLALMG